MIIFYNKKTGEIEGTIDGRVHPESHLKMWVGNKEETDRIVVQWEIVEAETEEGGVGAGVYKPSHPQQSIFEELDRFPANIHKYKVNPQTNELIQKTVEELAEITGDKFVPDQE